jgi:nucleoside-diphosphate-sugar epimerase
MALHVIFGTGPVGLHTAAKLLRDGETVRLVNRSGMLDAGRMLVIPEEFREGLDIVRADAMDIRQVLAASEGARFLYHCVNPLYHQWKEMLPPMQENLIEAALQRGAVLALSENLYMYRRGLEVLREDSPVDPPTRKGAIRQELHSRLQTAGEERGLKWVSIRASDFFGPGATDQSVFGTKYFLDPLFSGKKPTMLGNPDVPHTYTYVGDFGTALADAARNPSTYGRAWIVANDRTTTTGEMARRFMDLSSKRAALGTVPAAAVKLMGLFNPVMREIPEMLYQKTEPYVVDGSRYMKTTGSVPTEMDEGIRLTLAWYEEFRALTPESR